jgi:hypothetical protein
MDDKLQFVAFSDLLVPIDKLKFVVFYKNA